MSYVSTPYMFVFILGYSFCSDKWRCNPRDILYFNFSLISWELLIGYMVGILG